MGRAAHLGMIPGRAQILRPHLRIGLKAAATQDHRRRRDLFQRFARIDLNADHGAVVILQQRGGADAIADGNAVGLGLGEPGIGQPDALVQGADDAALLPFHPVADTDTGQANGGFHGDAGIVMQPTNGLVGFGDQDFGQGLIRLAGGHPHQIGHHFVFGVGRHILEECRQVFLHVGHQGAQGLRLAIGDAKHPAAVMGIAAPIRLGRLFQHQNPFGTLFPGRIRRRLGRIARADNDDIVI